MHHLPIEDQIREIVLSRGFKPIKQISVQKCDFAVRHPKFALNGFFKLFTAGRDLIENWIKVQEEVRENLELHADILDRHNTYLVFMLPIEELPPVRDIQPIISDEYVCRKLIVPIEDTNIQKSLLILPFYPFEIPELPKEAIPKNVVAALADSDFAYELISNLAGRVSDKTILRRLNEGLYEHEKRESPKVKKESIPEEYPVYLTRVKHIHIKNFRGIGKKLDLDTDADIVIIYGMNGTGKTSIIDAIEWTITGEVERLWGRNHDKPLNANESLVNLFSEERLTEVQIEFSKNGEVILEKRYVDLSKSRKSHAEIDNKRVWDDKTMIRELVGIRMPEVDVRRLRRVFLRSHFLGQNTILEFIKQNPENRYEAFSHMVGTQDYILFKEKTDLVIKILKKDLEIKLKNKNELDDEIKSVSSQINTKKKALKRLKKDIEEEISAQTLMNKIQTFIEELNIKVPKFLLQVRRKLPEIERLNKLVEIISSHTQRTSSKINTLKSLLIEAKNEEIRDQEIEKVTSNMDESIRNIKALKKLYNSKNSILKVLQKELNEYSRQKESYDRRIVTIKWFIETLPKYRRTQKSLAEERKHINKLIKERDSIQTKVKENKEKLLEATKKLQKFQKEIGDVDVTIGYLLEIKDQLPAWKENLRKISHFTASIQQLNKEIVQLQHKRAEFEEEIRHATDKLGSIQSTLDTEKEKQNRKLQLITRLKEYLDSPECPFCGHNWEKVEDLSKQVEKRLLFLARMLHDLGHYPLEKIEDFKPVLKHLMAIALEHETLLKKVSQIKTQIKSITAVIELKLKRCKQLETETAQLNKKIEDWKSKITYLKKKHPELEVQIIPEEVQILSVLRSYQTKLDKLKASQEEIKKKASSLDKQIKSVEDTKKESEEQIILHQQKETYYVRTLEQIDKEIAEKGITNLMDKNVKSLRISIEELLPKVGTVKKEMDSRRLEYGRVEADLSDMENNLKRLSEKCVSLDEHLKKLKDASETFRTNLQKEGFLRSKKIQVTIDKIEVKKGREINYFQKCKYLQLLSEQLKSIVTLSQLKNELIRMQKEEIEKEKQFNNIQTDYLNLSRWVDKLTRLMRLTVEKQKEQERNYFKMYSPAANLVYSRLNAHPLFNQIILKISENELKVLAQSSKGKQSTSEKINQISPTQFFSEAQLNIAALSIFLATALHQKWSGFSTIIIDDPVQNMDDFNVYAFLDLIRGLIMNGHQFILTTCNRDLYKLMLLKFRALSETSGHRFKAYRLKGIYAEGPELIKDC